MSKVFKSVKDVPKEELLAPGHRLCAGCAAGTAVRQILKASGREVVIVTPTSCLEVSTSYFPQSAWRVPWVHIAFENAAAVASGISNALKVLQRKGKQGEKADVMAIAGDGGTLDIGFQALSGMLERGDDVLFVCYDNEAYMNTGIQRSSATPFGAATTTSPPGKRSIGQRTEKKDLVDIAVAHGIPYAATACPSYPFDLMNKVKKGLDIDGPAVIHLLAPCPPGWRTETNDSIELGKLAVLTGLWPLYEVINGEIRLTVQVPKRDPVVKYLKAQGRFKHLDDEAVKRIQEKADRLAKRFGLGPLREQQ